MRVCSLLSVLFPLLCPVLLRIHSKCQMRNLNQSVEGPCPVNLMSLPETPGFYSVWARVWIKAEDFNSVTVEVENKFLRPILTKSQKKKMVSQHAGQRLVFCLQQGMQPSTAVWELSHKIEHVEAGKEISVFYTNASANCTVALTVPDPVPEFDLTVDHSSKSISVTVEGGQQVYARWCYRSPGLCNGRYSPQKLIDPSVNRAAHFVLPHLLPCICVQVYYTHTDARRREKCPFTNGNLKDVSNVLKSSKVNEYKSKLSWSSKCPSLDVNVSASLCWMQRERQQGCTPLPNTTLQRKDGRPLEFNISTVDKHPQMCVKFSIGNNHSINCLFNKDPPSWEAYVGPGSQSLFVYFKSSVQAKFSAQLCVLSERACTPRGRPHSVSLEENAVEARISVSPALFAENPCVQVWQSDPVLQGRRLLCPDYTHNRRGIYAVVALMFVVGTAMLSLFLYRFTTSGTAGLLCFQRPLLLVCSSDHSPHITAVCALASVLQEQLGVKVHTSLWAQSSQKQSSGASVGVADVGPLPWLYGQWESVCREHGNVLIVWSPNARRIYEKYWDGGSNVIKGKKTKPNPIKADSRYKKTVAENSGSAREELLKQKEKKDCVNRYDCEGPRRATSTMIEPVFTAALACLKGALQTCKGRGVAIVSFQGLGKNQHIPKALRRVPHYCLPQDFRGLIQELADCNRNKSRRHCWPRLLANVLSIWLAQQLAKRLQTLLHQTPSVTANHTSRKKLKWLLLPRPVKGDEEAKEEEALHRSPW